jgi:alkyldihydroxyacetonephosphate synthase
MAVPLVDRTVVNISLERLSGLRAFDATNLTATLGAGTAGPAVEAALRAHGCTLGHFPQSFEFSTVGGWVARRSSGRQSLRYGRIEQLLQSARLATPLRAFAAGGGAPASSARPGLREVVLGSEGPLGLLTDVTLRVRRLPERESFHAVFFPSWDARLGAVRTLVQENVALSMLRLCNPKETVTQLALAEGHERALAWLDRYLEATRSC